MSKEIKSPLYVLWLERRKEIEREIGKIKGKEKLLKEAWEKGEDTALATIMFLLSY